MHETQMPPHKRSSSQSRAEQGTTAGGVFRIAYSSRGVLKLREAALDQRMKEEALAKATTPQRQARQQLASVVHDELAHRRAALLDVSQSKDILLLYYGLVQSGMKENPAVARTAELMRVGEGKVFKAITVR